MMTVSMSCSYTQVVEKNCLANSGSSKGVDEESSVLHLLRKTRSDVPMTLKLSLEYKLCALINIVQQQTGGAYW